MDAATINPTKAEKAQQTRNRNREAKAEAARSEREAARQAVITRYGSEEAARAPTERERAILDAGAEYDWRRAAGEVAEGEYRDSANAWPMPTTYAAALAEQAEWDARDAEFFALDLQTYKRRPNSSESLPGDLEYRADAITNLVEYDMPLRTVAEIHDRLKRLHNRREARQAAGEGGSYDNWQDSEFVIDAVMRDLGAMAEQSGRCEVLHILDVDAKGHADGEPLNGQLAEDFVAAGYGVNRPCVIRYPDGQLNIGHKVAFTPAGIAWLQQEMEAGRF